MRLLSSFSQRNLKCEGLNKLSLCLLVAAVLIFDSAFALNCLDIFSGSAQLPGNTPISLSGQVTTFDEFSNDATTSLIGYLKLLIEDTNVLSPEQLIEFRDNLLADRIVNPIHGASQRGDSAGHIHYVQLQNILTDSEINWSHVVAWIDQYLIVHNALHDQRSDVQVSSQATTRPLEFALVPHGSYVQSYREERRFFFWTKKVPLEVRLTHDFLISDTPVTQAQWIEVMGFNPAKHRDGPFAVDLVDDRKRIRTKFQPDNPVESISWWSALVFLNRLSELHGLTPVYDLDEVHFQTVQYTTARMGYYDKFYKKDSPVHFASAANTGALHSVDSLVQSRKIKVNSVDGSVYRAEGYRLPTIFEYRHILCLTGALTSDVGPSDAQTLPVGHGRALKIAKDSYIYDLVGNVEEFTYDNIYPKFPKFTRNQTNPSGEPHDGARTDFCKMAQTSKNLIIGFRVVRTVDPLKDTVRK